MGARRASSASKWGVLAGSAAIVFALTGCVDAIVQDSRQAAIQSELLGESESESESESGSEVGAERAMGLAMIDGDRVSTAFVGADAHTEFEIGSISRLLTGLLLAEAIDRGEVRLDDRLGRYLPLGDATAASVTLGELATHTSGLRRVTSAPDLIVRYHEHRSLGQEPPGFSVAEMVELARAEQLGIAGRVVPSDLGAALLGHALAEAAGTEYPDLLAARVLQPLGMVGASVPATDREFSDGYPGGLTALGLPAEPWADPGWGPATGVHATLGDLVALARAVIGGPLAHSPVLDSIDVEGGAGVRYGYLWEADERGPRTLTGAAARTGGFGAALLIDREQGLAVALLVNRGDDVRRLAERYLDEFGG